MMTMNSYKYHEGNNNNLFIFVVLLLLNFSNGLLNHNGLFDGWGGFTAKNDNGGNSNYGGVDGGVNINEKDQNNEDCPPVAALFTTEYHLNNACNLQIEAEWRKSMLVKKIEKQKTLQETKTFSYIPNKETWYCPTSKDGNSESSIDIDPFLSNQRTGVETVWIVKNKASSPVVVSFLLRIYDEIDKEYYTIREVSAINSIVHPAHLDPKAILQPGEWKAVRAHEGHAFRVRELPEDTTGELGRILMQHRVGFIPITNKFGGDGLLSKCHPNDPDVEPFLGLYNNDNGEFDFAFHTDAELTLIVLSLLLTALSLLLFLIFRNGVGWFFSSITASAILTKVITGFIFLFLCVDIQIEETMYDPNYLRSTSDDISCNTLDIGFRNEVGCPLNVYYTGMEPYRPNFPTFEAEDNNNNVCGSKDNNQTCPVTTDDVEDINNTKEKKRKRKKKKCREHEQFKFHLGINHSPKNFVSDWDSKNKYESTYMGHSFLFRLANDEDIVVDSITIEPTYVRDCLQKTDMKIMIPIANTQREAAVLTTGESSSSSNVITISKDSVEKKIKEIDIAEYFQNNTSEALHENILSLGSISEQQNKKKE